MKTSLKLASVSLLALCALPLARLGAQEDQSDAAPPAPQVGTAAEAWTNAQASLKAIKAAAAARQQEPIHNEQEKFAASLKYIQEKGVGGTDKARLDGAINNAIAASEKVHAAADANDFAKVDSSLKTLEATMAMVEKHMTTPTK